MKNLYERLNDATVRLDTVICLAGAICDDTVNDSIRDLLEEDDDTLTQCFGELPGWLLEVLQDHFEAGDAFAQWAVDTNHLGFAIKVATPVMTWHGEDGHSYSWGHYNTRWVYGDTFDTAVEAGMAWVEERRLNEKSKGKRNAIS